MNICAYYANVMIIYELYDHIYQYFLVECNLLTHNNFHNPRADIGGARRFCNLLRCKQLRYTVCVVGTVWCKKQTLKYLPYTGWVVWCTGGVRLNSGMRVGEARRAVGEIDDATFGEAVLGENVLHDHVVVMSVYADCTASRSSNTLKRPIKHPDSKTAPRYCNSNPMNDIIGK